MKYFSKLQLDLSQRAARETLLELDHPYREHQLLWQLFSGAEKREFLFSRATGNLPVYYVVSSEPPAASSQAWIVETREYNPQLFAGEQLTFRLRVNPVVGRRHGDFRENGKARVHRHDVVMQAKRDMNWKTLPDKQRPALTEVIQQAGAEWLIERESKYGFSLDRESLLVDGYTQQRLLKKNAKPIEFSRLDFQGILTVLDSSSFIEKALFNGIGPAKAFGCGLMLVRRV